MHSQKLAFSFLQGQITTKGNNYFLLRLPMGLKTFPQMIKCTHASVPQQDIYPYIHEGVIVKEGVIKTTNIAGMGMLSCFYSALSSAFCQMRQKSIRKLSTSFFTPFGTAEFMAQRGAIQQHLPSICHWYHF